MQGVLDENVSALDGQLTGLDGTSRGGSPTPPRTPGDPAALFDKDLRELRAAWAAHTDVLFDALIEAQAEMGDLDNRRRNLAHQIDAVNDLLARLDETARLASRNTSATRCATAWAGSRPEIRSAWPLPCARAGPRPELPEWRSCCATAWPWPAPRRWSRQARPSWPAPRSGLRRRSSRHGRQEGNPARPGKGAPSTSQADVAPEASGKVKSLPFTEWAAANGFEGGRMGVLQALAGLERWSGFYDA